MKKVLGLCVVLVVGSTALLAVKVGDPYSKVIAEKGSPAGKIDAGGTLVLSYPDLTVKINNGKVTSVEAPMVRPVATAARVADKPLAAAVAKPEDVGRAGTWTTNFKTALVEAKEEKRHVFLFFTGSDWCGWCIRLQKEILTTPEFARYAGEKLVLVELDFPRSKPQTQAVKTQNRELASKYQVRGYPSVIVLDSSGKQVGQLGYQEGGPGPFIAKLQGM